MEAAAEQIAKIVVEVLKQLNPEKKVYIPRGVCAEKIYYQIENGKVRNVAFVKGCNGNAQGIARLIEGMDAAQVVERLKGINCNGKGTSCPDQLACALEQEIKHHVNLQRHSNLLQPL
jgi:uncharacterized protein (TIGR03905 family)